MMNRFASPSHIALFSLMLLAAPALARDAAFMAPGSSGGTMGGGDEALKVEPKNEIDTGETTLGVARRTNLFFVNQTGLPIQIEKVNVNNDSNITAELTTDDCSKQQTIAPQSRCNIEVSITPSSPGAWGVDVLMTHNGAGRITRAKITGKTSGSSSSADNKSMGLSLSAKEATPVNFGDLEIGSGKAVRSALMVNDSTDPISIFSIDVIEAANGLQRLEQGCAVDMELKPGESCPVTLVWDPSSKGIISTDLIIRHSGKLGFAVIPIRGSAKDAPGSSGGSQSISVNQRNEDIMSGKRSLLPIPPSSLELQRAADKIADAATGPHRSSGAAAGDTSTPATLPAANKVLRLIGTVGNRVILIKSDNTTAIVGLGETVTAEGATFKVTAIGAKSVDLSDGAKKPVIVTLQLQAASELVSRAAEQSRARQAATAAAATGTASGTTGSSVPLPAPVATTGGTLSTSTASGAH